MQDLIGKKKILIGSSCLALLCVASIVTINYTDVTVLKSLAFLGNGFSLGAFLLYHLLKSEISQRQKLQKSATYITSIESQIEPICQFMPDGTLTAVNDACCKYFGQSREQLIGNKFLVALVSKAIAAQYKPFPLLGILPENQSNYLQAYRFFNLSSELLVISSFDSYFRYIHPSWERFLGYTTQDLSAQPFLEFVHPEDREATKAQMHKLAEGMLVIQFENRYRCQDGSYKWLSWTAQPFLEEKLIYAVAHEINNVYDELHLRKQIELALQQQREQSLLDIALKRIRQSLNLEEILATTIREVRQLLNADQVLFFQFNDQKTGKLVAESVTTNLNQEFPPKCYNFYSQCKLRLIPDVAKDELASCLSSFIQQQNVKSKMIVPIIYQVGIESNNNFKDSSSAPKLWGLLIVQACSDYRQWQQTESDLLEAIANQLSLTIQQADLYQQLQTELAERKRVEESLRQAQAQLEIKVQQRTAELTQSNQSLSAEINERKKLETVLRQREQEFKALVENAPDIIARLDKNLRHVYINPAIEKATNIAQKEFIGKTNQDLGIVDESISNLEEVSKKVFASGVEERIEFHYPTLEGIKHYQSRIVPELGSDGSVTSILAIGRDITELKQIEAALRVQEYQLRAIFESVVDAIVIIDDGGFYVDANPAASKLFNEPYSQLIGKYIFDFIEPGFDVELAWSEFQKKKQVMGVLHLVRLDGTARDVEYSAIANFLPNRHLILLHDITERQQAEAALREREEQLTAIAANIPGAVYRCLIKSSGAILLLYVSEGIKELVGFDCQEAIANPRDLLKLIHPEDRSYFYSSKIRLKNSLQSFTLKFRVITPSGKVKWIRDSARYFPSGEDGDVIVDGVVLDISDVYDELRLRKQAELALQENQRLLQQISDTTPAMIYIYDLNKQYNVYLNRFGHEFFGKTDQEIRQMGAELFQEILSPEQLPQLGELRQRLIATKEGEVIENELCLKNSQGEWRWFHTWEVVFTRTSNRRPEQILGTAIDITEQKRSQEIYCALETEKELRKLQLRFFSMASHEFRTPLSTILVTAQLLGNSAQELSFQKRQRNLQRIETIAKQMTQLLDDILTFNRAETGKLELQPHFIELEQFCLHLIGEIQLNAGCQYTLNFSSQGESRRVFLDEKIIHSILTNLLSNAIKYSPQGGEVNLILIYQPNELIFQVEDRGIGIPLEYQQQPFEPFHRGTNTGNIPGTGLGLAVIKKCLDLQGGTISIDSQVGVGTKVIINIPISKPQI